MEAFRYNELVYIPTPKHASRSYTYLFENILKWDKIETEDINWNTDRIFAHIIHPYKRHLKGTAQMLYQNNLIHLINHTDFQKIFSAALFDHHSYPITYMFGLEKAYKIDWIPLDNELVDGDSMTKSLLQSFGIDNIDFPNINQSSQIKKDLFNKLVDINKKLPAENSLIHIYDDDLLLYSSINDNLRFHEIFNLPWKDCSWLTNYNKYC